MPQHLSVDELDSIFQTKAKGRALVSMCRWQLCCGPGHSPAAITTVPAKKRRAAKQSGSSACSVRLALRGGSFKRGRSETRGRKLALSLKDLAGPHVLLPEALAGG